MPCPALPIDILLLIMEEVSLPTISKMTRTCLALRHAGVRFLLDGGVYLTAGSSVVSFFQFMRADAKNRFQFLRSLKISTGEILPREVDALLGLVTHPLLALDSLILRQAEPMLKSMPKHSSTRDPTDHTPLIRAFSTLKTLRHLTLDECDIRACTLISAIRSPLKTITIGFTPMSAWHNAEDAERRNPIVLLANLSDTLEEITTTNAAMSLDHILYDVVYPSVRRFSVTYDLTWVLKTVACTTTFPNLTHFSFTVAGEGHPHEFFHALLGRTANKADLEHHGPGWTHLEELVGGLTDLYIFGPAWRRVTTLRLTGPVPIDAAVAALDDVLGDTRPANLAVSFVGAHLFEDDTLASILGSRCGAELRTLEMEVCLDFDEIGVDAQIVLGNIARTLAVLPLRALTLTLNYGLFADGTGRAVHPAGDAFEALDLEAAASVFRAAMPSLVDVIVRRSTDCAWYELVYGAEGGSDSSGYLSLYSPDDDGLEGDLGGLMEEDEDGW